MDNINKEIKFHDLEELRKMFRLKLVHTKEPNYIMGYELHISKELAEYWNLPEEKPVCQYDHCHSIINLPAYFCKSGVKLYCYDCVQSGKDICIYSRMDNHSHFRIVGIRVEE